MADDLERRLREIQNRPSRTEAEKEELLKEVRNLRAENERKGRALEEEKSMIAKERDTLSRQIKESKNLIASLEKHKHTPNERRENQDTTLAVHSYNKTNLDQIERVYSKMMQGEKIDIEHDLPENFTKSELSTFVEEIMPKYTSSHKFNTSGYFIIKMIKNVLTREPNVFLNFSGLPRMIGVGVNLQQGCLEIKGDAEDVGGIMDGGKIILKGNTEDAGSSMKGGELVVYGNTKWAGQGMDGGTITIKGNAEYASMSMTNGNVTIEGNVVGAGQQMEGGTLTVHGYAEHVGGDAKGGKIFLNGDYGTLESNKWFNSLEIYHKGKRI